MIFKCPTYDKLPFVVAGDPKSRVRSIGFRIYMTVAILCTIGLPFCLADFFWPELDFIANSDFAPTLFISIFAPLLFGGLAVLLVIAGKGNWRIFRIDKEEVSCFDGRDTRLWQQPLSAHIGILWREGWRGGKGPYGGGGMLQVLYLLHGEVTHTFKCVEAQKEAYALACGEARSQALNLPFSRA